MSRYSEVLKDDIADIIHRDIDFIKLKDKTVLLTGATGFIGKYLLYTLLGLNDCYHYNIKIIAIVRSIEKAQQSFNYFGKRNDLKIIKQDVCDPMKIEDAVDYIIHGASIANPGAFADNPVGTIAGNTVGTYNLLNLAVEKKAKRFSFLSSALLYRQFEPEKAGCERAIKEGCEYPLSKLTGEALCAAFFRQYQLDCISFRLIGIYGPGYPSDFKTATMEFCTAVRNETDITINGDGKIINPHCYVSDAVDCVFRGMLAEQNIHSCDVFGIESTLLEWAQSFADLSKKTGINILNRATVHLAPQKFDPLPLNKIGWKNTVSIQKGVEKMIYSMD